MNKTTYVIQWTTGDTDTCYGRRDLMDLLKELGYTIDGSNVMDGDHVAGTLKTISN
jgi:hypothetical protein